MIAAYCYAALGYACVVALVVVSCRPLRRELARQNARLHVPGDA